MNTSKNLAKLQSLELRSVWNHEARDFTKWLSYNISELGNAIGLELENVEEEAKVGSFSLDLLAKDLGTNKTVIIENQLEATDHIHLGQLLTYASGLDAGVIVWVAKKFKDEHRQALDWLNQRTSNDTSFFGIVVELWKIDESRPAPHFRIVASPNEWHRKTVRQPLDRSSSEKGEKYQAFFQKLIDCLREKGFSNARVAQPQSWYSFSGGTTNVNYRALFSREGNAVIDIYFNKDSDWNLKKFGELQNDKIEIEELVDESLVWDPMDGNKATRIYSKVDGNIDDNSERLAEVTEWMIEKLLTFRSVFNDRIL